MRCNIPPNRESHKDGLIMRNIGQFTRDLRAACRVVHLNARTALFIIPIEIVLGIGNGGHNLIKVCPYHIRNFFGNFLCPP